MSMYKERLRKVYKCPRLAVRDEAIDPVVRFEQNMLPVLAI